MSGYGGNLTYPDNKQFRNSVGTIATPGTAGQEFRLVVDRKIQVGANARTLFIESTGDYIPGEVGATVTRVDHKVSTPKVSQVVLENRAPTDTSNHELGFIQKAIAQHPGVMNDNFYGQLRTYAHKFDYLDPVTGGLISDLDIQRAYSDINQQITDDTGRYNGHMQGNYESVVNAHTTITLSGIATAVDTVSIPGAGLFNVPMLAAGAVPAALQPYIGLCIVAADATIAGAAGDTWVDVLNAVAIGYYAGQEVTLATVAPAGNYTITNVVRGATNTRIHLADFVRTNTAAGTIVPVTPYIANTYTNVGVATPGYGFEFTLSALTISSHDIKTVTKVEYQGYSHQLQEVTGRVTTVAAGSFELLPWAEVFREFSHMGHDVPLSNHWDKEKPANITNWTKFILETNHSTGTFHGASHGGNYKERMVLFVTDPTAANVDNLGTLFTTWTTA